MQASAKVENIIREAKGELTIITPFLKLSPLFLERLKDADDRGVRTKLVYGKKELKSEEYGNLNQLKNLDLLYCDSLHAKCYFNEEQMVITSLNLYDYSIKNNREMGVHIKRGEDVKLFNDALVEASSIIKSSIVEKISENNENDAGKKIINNKMGFCIRYHETIPFNPDKPLCPSCFSVWVEFGDPDYPENNCHACGEIAKVSFRKPLCKKCYDNLNEIQIRKIR